MPWNAGDQVEQDLILVRLMIEIATDLLLGDEFVMGGGTCFHMLWLDRPWRYSEDLDYVRRTDGPVGPIFDDKLADPSFVTDAETLLADQPSGYRTNAAEVRYRRERPRPARTLRARRTALSRTTPASARVAR